MATIKSRNNNYKVHTNLNHGTVGKSTAYIMYCYWSPIQNQCDRPRTNTYGTWSDQWLSWIADRNNHSEGNNILWLKSLWQDQDLSRTPLPCEVERIFRRWEYLGATWVLRMRTGIGTWFSSRKSRSAKSGPSSITWKGFPTMAKKEWMVLHPTL